MPIVLKQIHACSVYTQRIKDLGYQSPPACKATSRLSRERVRAQVGIRGLTILTLLMVERNERFMETQRIQLCSLMMHPLGQRVLAFGPMPGNFYAFCI